MPTNRFTIGHGIHLRGRSLHNEAIQFQFHGQGCHLDTRGYSKSLHLMVRGKSIATVFPIFCITFWSANGIISLAFWLCASSQTLSPDQTHHVHTLEFSRSWFGHTWSMFSGCEDHKHPKHVRRLVLRRSYCWAESVSNPTDLAAEYPLKDNWFRKREVARLDAFPQRHSWFNKQAKREASAESSDE